MLPICPADLSKLTNCVSNGVNDLLHLHLFIT